MPPRTVVVTGAAGSVAGQLLPGLEGRYDLRLVDRVRSEDNGATVVIGELTDPATVDRAVAGADAVVHLAGNPEPDAPWEELREPNVEGFVTLLAAARRHAVRRVVFASSVHAMGGYEGRGRWPIDPSWPPSPCCAYGATKAFDEALARAFAYRSELSLVGLRFGFCSPEVTPAQAVAGWLAPGDLQRLVVGALEADVSFGVHHGVSWASRRRWDVRSAMTDLGYEPGRDTEYYAEPVDARGHLSTCAPEGAPLP